MTENAFHKYESYSKRNWDDVRQLANGGPVNIRGIVTTYLDYYHSAIWENLKDVSLVQEHYLNVFTMAMENLDYTCGMYWDYVHSRNQVLADLQAGRERFSQANYPPLVAAAKACVDLAFSEDAVILHNPFIILPLAQIRQLCSLPTPNMEYELYSEAYNLVERFSESESIQG